MDLTPEQQSALTAVETFISQTVAKETHSLQGLVTLVNDALILTMKDGCLQSDLKLSSDELELLAIKIPAECMALQSKLNQYSARCIARKLEADLKISSTQLTLIGEKGTAEERKKRAETANFKEIVNRYTSKAIVKALQDTIERADKVYEGIKKVMDSRSKEMWYDRKQR